MITDIKRKVKVTRGAMKVNRLKQYPSSSALPANPANQQMPINIYNMFKLVVTLVSYKKYSIHYGYCIINTTSTWILNVQSFTSLFPGDILHVESETEFDLFHILVVDISTSPTWKWHSGCQSVSYISSCQVSSTTGCSWSLQQNASVISRTV